MQDKLYHLPYSKAVGGFYQSEVFVVAASLEEAKGRVRAKMSEWFLDPEMETGGGFYHTTSVPDYDDWHDAEEVDRNYHSKMFQLEEELVNLVELDDLAIVRHST